jgi:hypothetical protein
METHGLATRESALSSDHPRKAVGATENPFVDYCRVTTRVYWLVLVGWFGWLVGWLVRHIEPLA